MSPDGIQPADGTYAGVVQGTGVLTKIGGGTLTLTGTNTYTGGTNLNVGAIAVAADNALGAATGPLTFNGGTLRFNSNFNLAADTGDYAERRKWRVRRWRHVRHQRPRDHDQPGDHWRWRSR